MQCPIDQTDLVMTERQGVEIDYCPKCRGVWLDRGELDKIIDRASDAARTTNAGASGDFQTREVAGMRGNVKRLDDRDRYADDDREGYTSEDRRPRKRKKCGGFLEDLFDF